MMMLKWSSTLAAAAQKHSSSCPGSTHSKDLKGVGENMAQKAGSNLVLSATTDLTPSVQAWFDEKKDAGPYKDGGKFNGFGDCTGVCGHYTQVVWQAANEIGCGVASCPLSGMQGYQLTCQYGTSVSGLHGGNMIKATLFTKGTACSACPDGFKTCSTSPAGLCTSAPSGASATTSGSGTSGSGTSASGTSGGSTAAPTTTPGSGTSGRQHSSCDNHQRRWNHSDIDLSRQRRAD